MTELTNNNDLKSLKDSKALKVCYWFTNISFYLSCFAAILVVVLLGVNMFGGVRTLKYMQLPIIVTYDDISRTLPLDQTKSDELVPVVGFERVKLDVSKYEKMAQMMWLPLILLLGVIYIIYLFKIFLKTVRLNSPFDKDNPKRLKLIGYLITAAGPIVGITSNIYARIFIHLIDLPGASIEIPTEMYPFTIFLGLMIVVIAQVFEIAVKMKLEQDLTV